MVKEVDYYHSINRS